MIAYLSGKTVAILDQQIIVKTPSGVGYILSFNPKKRYLTNENVEFFVLEITSREGQTQLFAFDTLDERKWTGRLMKVPGVGPKMAAMIVYNLGPDMITKAVATSDLDAFLNMKGLGEKTAKKILLELKTDIDISTLQNATSLTKSEFSLEFVESLSRLGYKRSEIVSSISSLKKKGDWQEDNLMHTVKQALGILGKK